MNKKCIYFSILISYLGMLEGDITQVRTYISPGCEGRIVHTSYEGSLVNTESPSVNIIEFETSSSGVIEFDSTTMSNFMFRKCDEEFEEEFEEEIVLHNEDGEYPVDIEKAEHAFKKALRMMHRQEPT